MRILYLGDNAGTSAEYLKDVLAELEHTTNHIDSASLLPDLSQSYEVIILSDYPAKQISVNQAQIILNQIKSGSRLVMLGGWDSFNGRGKSYFQHPIANALPVTLQADDDRVNAPQGLVLRKSNNLSSDLPLDWQNPPIICGYNAAEIKPNAVSHVDILPIQTNGESIHLLTPQPLIVKGSYGKGTVIACMTDIAPHWCGGLVDWGSERRVLPHVEVGDMYILFIRLLLDL